jgi:hypothetical protein
VALETDSIRDADRSIGWNRTQREWNILRGCLLLAAHVTIAIFLGITHAWDTDDKETWTKSTKYVVHNCGNSLVIYWIGCVLVVLGHWLNPARDELAWYMRLFNAASEGFWLFLLCWLGSWLWPLTYRPVAGLNDYSESCLSRVLPVTV